LIPFFLAESKLFTNPGKCLAEQTDVKAPGRPNKITF